MAKKDVSGGVVSLAKCPTGITGLDEVTEGGLPRGRPTLVCGGAGSGKTLLAMEFIVRGITEFDESGVYMSFEETAEELAANTASLGFDLPDLIRRKKLSIDYVHIERSEIEETGEYTLEGLFVRLAAAIDEVGARRVALDTVEALFAGMPNEGIIRAELRRLFRWFKQRGVTVVITGEKGDQTLTRYGVEEYVSDCVIFLDHRVTDEVATRRMRVVKYRGSKHGTNEYPTLIDETGLSILPITSLGLTYAVSTQRISTGVERLDAMLGGEGYYKGSTILVSGTAGTGKSSLAASFADSVCRNGGRFVYLSFEESADQIIRNMRSVGIDLEPWRTKGNLIFHTVRPTLYGLELHLATIHKLISQFKPNAVAIDPITNLTAVAGEAEAKLMLTRLIDFLKNEGITGLFTSLTSGEHLPEQTEAGVSSLMDTWILVRMVESTGERNRILYVLKSRGMSHSNQMREFRLTGEGIKLADVYVGPGEVLTGTARTIQEAADSESRQAERQATQQRQRELEQEQARLKVEAEALTGRLNDIAAELEAAKTAAGEQRASQARQRQALSEARKAD